MAQVNKIDSNVTGLRYVEEISLGTLNGTSADIWYPLEPNSYNDFGGQITNIARNPINESRQRQKGVTVDLDASGGFNSDLTQTNFQDLLQGFFFADARPKGEEEPTSVTVQAGDDTYEMTSTTGFHVGDLVWASGFDDAENNGLKHVTAVVADTTIAVSETLVTDASPATGAKVVVVGVQGTAGDLDVDASGSLPIITSTSLDFTTLGLIPGEWIRVGGNTAQTQFSNAVNNGFARIKSIATNALTLDKTQQTMATEASTTETVDLYFGRVLKNESDPTLIVRRTYQFERTLGKPDDAQPSQIQAEYLVGSVANELTFNFNTADKITADLSFVSIDHETIDGPTALKTGTKPALVSEDAYNTSNDFARVKMHVLDPADSNPTALFAYLTEFTVAINNNVSPNKAISVLGAFDLTAGQFVVSGSATAYFANVSAIAAIRNNSDVTMDFTIVHGNAGEKTGVAVDIPLITLGDGRANVEQDQPITLPLTTDAGADRVFNHTLLMVFFDYLPDAADPSP